MSGIGAVALFWAVAAPAQVAEEAWPDAKPGKVRRTPDWSDFRIYPEAARRKSQEGAVTASLLVDAAGSPTSCRIAVSSSHAELDDGTCSLMMTMSFDPARDAAGTGMPSVFTQRIVWLLTTPRPFASSSVSVTLASDGARVTGCDVASARGAYTALWSAAACRMLRDAYYLGASPVGGTVTVAVRLDAGDRDPLLAEPWPSGSMMAEQRVAFRVTRSGDPTDCHSLTDHGFGERGLNNLSPCGRLVSMLWLKDAKGREGVVETRIYRTPDVER